MSRLTTSSVGAVETQTDEKDEKARRGAIATAKGSEQQNHLQGTLKYINTKTNHASEGSEREQGDVGGLRTRRIRSHDALPLAQRWPSSMTQWLIWAPLLRPGAAADRARADARAETISRSRHGHRLRIWDSAARRQVDSDLDTGAWGHEIKMANDGNEAGSERRRGLKKGMSGCDADSWLTEQSAILFQLLLRRESSLPSASLHIHCFLS